MKKLKKVLALGLSSVMMLSLAACGNSGTTSTDKKDDGATATPGVTSTPEAAQIPDLAPTSETVELKMSWWGGDSRHKATQDAVNAFMVKYPNIKVSVDFGAWTGWEEKMAMAFTSNTAADLVQINWNWLTSYSADGSKFLDLNLVKDQLDLTQFDQKALDQCIVANELQAIPVSMTGRIFYWNKATFDKAGIALPTSLADLKAAGETFKTKLGDDFYPLVLGEYDRTILMVHYLESKYGTDWVVDGKLQYTEAQVEEGLQFIQDLEDAHVTPTLATIKGDGAESLDKNNKWMEGTYAGIFEWDSSASKFQKALNEGQEFVVGDYFADMGPNKGGFSKVSLGFSITESSKHPREAALLMNFLLNEEEGAKIMASERGIPLSKAALKVCTDNSLLNKTVAEANGKVLAWVSNKLDPKFEDAKLKSTDGTYYEVFEGLSYGDYTVKDAAKEMVKGINAVLAK